MVAFDTETYLIERGHLTPPLVCLTVAWDGEMPAWLPAADPATVRVEPERRRALLRAEAVTGDVVLGLLAEPLLVAANAPYDLAVLAVVVAELDPARTEAVLAAIFCALREGRVSDVQIRERLLALAAGRLKVTRVSLADLVRRYLGDAIGDALLVKKRAGGPLDSDEDPWRTRYAELDGVSLERWPPEAVDYALDDASFTLEVWLAQARLSLPYPYPLVLETGRIVSEDREARAAWALHLQAAYGVRTDGARVASLREAWAKTIEASVAAGTRGGWLRPPLPEVRTELPAAERAAFIGTVAAAVPSFVPERTPGGKLSTSRAAVVAALEAAPPGLRAPKLVDWLDSSRPAGSPGTLDTARLRSVVTQAFDGAPPYTDPSATFPQGQVSIATDTLLVAARTARGTWADDLRVYAEGLQATRWETVWGPILEVGASKPITSRPNHLVETGRTSWSDPPWQQPPAEGGVRECTEPRPGFVFCSVDFSTLELCTLAQVHVWLGLGSTLADAINAGQDLHLRTAAGIAAAEGSRVGTTYEEALALYKAGDPTVKHRRKLAKVANFGFPGGLGAQRFVDYAAGVGVTVSVEEALTLRDVWLRTWPEMRGYFALINRLLGDRGTALIQHPLSGRLRGEVGYTDGCNGFFQGLAADGAKAAAFALAEAAYCGTGHARARDFQGARPILFIHDEIIAELPEARASAAADAMAAIMVDVMHAHTPDVTIKAEPCLMRFWTKKAETLRAPSGEWLIWEANNNEGKAA